MKNKNTKYQLILLPIAINLLVLFILVSFWFGLPLSLVLIIGHILHVSGERGSEYLEERVYSCDNDSVTFIESESKIGIHDVTVVRTKDMVQFRMVEVNSHHGLFYVERRENYKSEWVRIKRHNSKFDYETYSPEVYINQELKRLNDEH